MKTPAGLVAAALTAAILLTGSLVIAAAPRSDFLTFMRGVGRDDEKAASLRPHPHLWKIKNAPSAINANPSPWFQPSGSLR